MHQSSEELAFVFAGSVVPNEGATSVLEALGELSRVPVTLATIFLNGIAILGHSILPLAFVTIILMFKPALAVEAWILDMTSVISPIWEHNHSFIILSNTILKKTMEIRSVLKYCIAQSLRQPAWVELTLIEHPFGRNVEEYFFLYASIQKFTIIYPKNINTWIFEHS